MFKKSGLNYQYFRVLLCIFLILMLTVCFAACGSSSQEESAIQESSVDSAAEQAAQAKLEQIRKDAEKGMLILVNKEHHVDKEFVPEDLAPIKYYAADRSSSCRYMREEAAQHFHMLVEAAAEDGFDIVMTTAYRSYGFQEILWNNNVIEKGSEEEANKTSARPGESEHQTGLAVDISTAEIDYRISYDFAETGAGQWIEENAHKFGFILRYLEGKTDITGYSYEPWHIRYVGVTAAADIHERGITLEEYLEELAL